MNWKLNRIEQQVDQCLRDSLVFSREADGGRLVEAEVFRHDQSDWLVLAAGISESEARQFFPKTSKRAERATVPLSISGAGSGALLYVIRPVDSSSAGSNIATFSRDIPLVEFHTGYFRLLEVEGKNVSQVRWEYDSQSAQSDPVELWLAPWMPIIGHNPAHAPSHLHINSPPLIAAKTGRVRQERATNELRLAVGVPNPLAFLLSIASWLRSA